MQKSKLSILQAKDKIQNLNKAIRYSLYAIGFQDGFTLIELMAVFSATAIISIVGIIAFVNYARVSALNSAASEFVTMLHVARSRAQSQLKPSACSGKTLNGYQVSICNLTGSICNSSSVDYQLDVVCAGFVQSPPIEQKKLPQNYNLKFDTETETKTIFFNVVSGTVTGAGNVKINFNSGYGIECKKININDYGIISQPDC